MRYGTRTNLKRRWTPRGHRPSGRLKIGYEYGYLYMGINPYKGEIFALLLPDMSGDSFKVYIEEFQKHIKSQEQQSHALILGGARNHRQSAITMTNLDMIKLPAYCPELNPVERFFKEIRRELANKVFEGIKEVEKRLIIILRKYHDNPLIVQKLTLFPYLKKTI